MRKTLMALVVPLSLPVAEPVAAQGQGPLEVLGSVSLASDYTFRGISQTRGKMAMQAGVEVGGPSGVYGGVWGSNLNFGEASPDGRAQAEIDLFGGIQRTVGGEVDVDLGLVYYAYPGTSSDYSYNFVELGLGASRDFTAFSTGVSAAYSPDYFAGSGSAFYVSGDLGVPIPSTPFSVGAAVGHQSIEDNAAFDTPDYTDWSIGVSAGLSDLEVGASYIGTNLDRSECFGGANLCDSRFVVSASLGLRAET